LSRLSLAVTLDNVTPTREALETQENSTRVTIYAKSSPTPTNPRDAEGDGNSEIKSVFGTEA